ncbi:MAG: hypothetical protein C4345_02915 [Chloroflexota bacterium]
MRMSEILGCAWDDEREWRPDASTFSRAGLKPSSLAFLGTRLAQLRLLKGAVKTPEAWPETWSGACSRASLKTRAVVQWDPSILAP